MFFGYVYNHKCIEIRAIICLSVGERHSGNHLGKGAFWLCIVCIRTYLPMTWVAKEGFIQNFQRIISSKVRFLQSQVSSGRRGYLLDLLDLEIKDPL